MPAYVSQQEFIFCMSGQHFLTSRLVLQLCHPAPSGRGDGAPVGAGVGQLHIPQLQGSVSTHHLLRKHRRAALKFRVLLLQVVLPPSKLVNQPGHSSLCPPNGYAAHPDVGLEGAAQEAALADVPRGRQGGDADGALSCEEKGGW